MIIRSSTLCRNLCTRDDITTRTICKSARFKEYHQIQMEWGQRRTNKSLLGSGKAHNNCRKTDEMLDTADFPLWFRLLDEGIILYSYKTTFSEISPANRNRLGRNFTGRRWVTCTIPCKLLAPSAKWMRYGVAEFFVTEATHRFTHFPAEDFRELWTQNVNPCLHETFGIEFLIFKGVIYPENLILGMFASPVTYFV